MYTQNCVKKLTLELVRPAHISMFMIVHSYGTQYSIQQTVQLILSYHIISSDMLRFNVH